MAAHGAANKARELAPGLLEGLIVKLVVPLGYEVYDAITNGVCHGLDTSSALTAIGRRVKRVTSYLLTIIPEALSQLLHGLGELLCDLFYALWQNVILRPLKIIVEGFGVAVEAVRILLTPGSELAPGEKADAIAKLVGGFLIGGVLRWALDQGLTALGLPPLLGSFLTGCLTAIGTAMFFYVLDQADLFSAKASRRHARIMEVFALRTQAIREATAGMAAAASETLRAQRQQFDSLRARLADPATRNAALDEIAACFEVTLPYASPEEFVAYIHANRERILIGA
jgi:hypothetical protein